ncbi:MAG: MFS transporter, partial [Acetobacteraceae bacterium]
MRLPAALKPLEHPAFFSLFMANLITSLGTWMQNTGAGWLMTVLQPNALTVSLVQAATILPICLLALPAGAIADIVDRRRFLILTQIEMLVAAALLAALTAIGAMNAWTLLALTFAVGVGTAMNGPAWQAIIPETVPRADLGQAVALNSVSFNIARAVGPAIAGGIVAAFGPALAFALNAFSFLSPVHA